MRERINRLAKGIIDTEVPELQIQPETLDEEVAAGGIEKKELYIVSRNGLHIKGLLYSSNSRVKVLTGSFGGLRNHVAYQVDSGFMDYGDVIEGSFYLVSNGGEREIPYRFSVKAGLSGKTLMKLREPRDFANMARQDYETAVRVFEFKDFVDVPFMQDSHIRTIYDGLRGHGNRYSQVEQFLIALGMKKPVELIIEERHKEYHNIEQVTKDTILLKRSGWGYLPVTAVIDGGFIQTVQKNYTNMDFHNGILEFPYQISPGGLHGGRNFGSISFETLTGSASVEIQVINSGTARETAADAERFTRYLGLRLDYMSGSGDQENLKKQLVQEAENLRLAGGQSADVSLLEAEAYLLAGHKEAAGEHLEECREKVQESRQENPGMYCLHQYLALQLNPDEERLNSLKRLVRKYMEEGSTDYLLFYVFTQCEEDYCFENPGEVLTRMKVMYGGGCHSPFLYEKAVMILNDSPQLLYGMGAFESQVIHFGARRGEIREELAVKAAKLASVSRHFQPLQCRTLKLLYEKYPRKEILEAICGLMIRGQCREESDFPWYEKALEQQISLTRLYEYFLYSLPKNYEKLVPREVLLYFSYDNDLDRGSKAVLYANIIRYMNSQSKLYKDYQKNVGAFAAGQILQNRIDSSLAVIYDEAIYPDMVDENIARALPAILNSCRISCDDSRMRSVVVRYEELTEEGVYPLVNGAAYVPVFFEGSCILFQDVYGNRYTDVRHVRTPVLHKPELEERCFEVYPEHPMLLLGACRKAAEKETPDEEDILIIERSLMKLRLHPLYRSKLAARIIRYYREQPGKNPEEGPGPDAAPLLSMEKTLLSGDQRAALCETFINLGYIQEAYKLIQTYHCRISAERLRRLCSRMILNQLFDQDDLLLSLAFEVFSQGQADSVILDYLCEHYNGLSDQMYRVLLQGASEQVETYDLAERLLAQMLFSDTTDKIDRVFALYMKGRRTSESIVKAYFTMKSAAYFLRGTPAGEPVFRYLEGMIHGAIEKEKLSAIYLLALTKFYASQEQLDAEQKELCQMIVDILLDEGMVFPYFKQLAKHVRIPEDIMDKGILQYIGRRDSKVDLQVRILPQEQRFHGDEMKRVYQGVFIKQKILFEGEVMEYRIYEHQGTEPVLMEEGRLTYEYKGTESGDSRFHLLNQMSMYMNLKEEAGLHRTMEEYLKKTAAVEELFKPL